MNDNEIWTYLWNRKVIHSRPFDRDFIWVQKEAFESVKRYFIPEYNIFHKKGGSMRTRPLLRHIQAVRQGDYVFLHKDTGNVARFLPLGLIHLFVDVLPYLLVYERRYTRATGAPKRSLYGYPPERK